MLPQRRWQIATLPFVLLACIAATVLDIYLSGGALQSRTVMANGARQVLAHATIAFDRCDCLRVPERYLPLPAIDRVASYLANERLN